MADSSFLIIMEEDEDVARSPSELLSPSKTRQLTPTSKTIVAEMQKKVDEVLRYRDIERRVFEYEPQVEELLRSLEDSKKLLMEANKTSANLKDELKSVKEELSTTQKDRDLRRFRLEKELDQKEATIVNLRKDVNDYKSHIELLSSRHARKVGELTNGHGLSLNTSTMESCKGCGDESKVRRLESENNELQEKLKICEEANGELRRRVDALLTEWSNSIHDLQTMSTELNDVVVHFSTSQLDSSLTFSNLLEVEWPKWTDFEPFFKMDVPELNLDTFSFTENEKAPTTSFKSCSSEILDELIRSTQAEEVELRSYHLEMDRLYDLAVSEFRQMLQTFQNKFIDSSKDVLELQAKVESLQSEIQTLNGDNAELVMLSNRKREESTETESNLRTELEKLKSQLEELNSDRVECKGVPDLLNESVTIVEHCLTKIPTTTVNNVHVKQEVTFDGSGMSSFTSANETLRGQSQLCVTTQDVITKKEFDDIESFAKEFAAYLIANEVFHPDDVPPSDSQVFYFLLDRYCELTEAFRAARNEILQMNEQNETINNKTISFLQHFDNSCPSTDCSLTASFADADLRSSTVCNFDATLSNTVVAEESHDPLELTMNRFPNSPRSAPMSPLMRINHSVRGTPVQKVLRREPCSSVKKSVKFVSPLMKNKLESEQERLQKLLDEKIAACSSLETTVALKNSEIATMEKRVEELEELTKKYLNDMQKINEEYVVETEKCKAEAINFQAQLQNVRGRLIKEVIDMDVNSNEEDLLKLPVQDVLGLFIKVIMQQCQALQSVEKAGYDKDREEWTKEMLQVTTSNQALTEQIRDITSKLDEALALKSEVTNAKRDLEKEVSLLHEKLKARSKECEENHVEKGILDSYVKEQDDSKALVLSLQSEIESNRQECASLYEKLKQLEADKDRAEEKCRESEVALQEETARNLKLIEEKTVEMCRLDTELGLTQREKSLALENVSKLKEEIDILNQRLQETVNNLESVCKKNENSIVEKGVLDALVKEQEERQAFVSKLQAEFEAKKQECALLHEKVVQLNADKMQAEEKCVALECESLRCSKLVEDKAAELCGLQTEFDTIRREKEVGEENILKLNDKVQVLNAAKIEADLKLENEIKRFSLFLKEKTDEMSCLQTQFDTIRREKEMSDEKIFKLTGEIEALNTGKMEAEERCNEAQSALKNETHRCCKVIEEKTVELSGLQTEFDIIRRDKEIANEKISKLTNDIEALNAAKMEAEEKFREANSALQNETLSSRKLVEDKTNEISRLQTDFDAIRRDKEIADEKISKLTCDIEALHSAKIEAEEKLRVSNSSLENENGRCSGLVAEKTAELCRLQAEIETVREGKVMTEAKLLKLASDVEILNADKIVADEKCKELNAVIDVLNEEVCGMKANVLESEKFSKLAAEKVSELCRLQTEFDIVRKDKELAEENIAKLKGDIEVLNQRLLEAVNDLASQCKKCENNHVEKGILDTLVKEQEKNEVLVSSLQADLESQRQRSCSILESVKNDIEFLKKSLVTSESEKNSAIDELESLRSEKQSLQVSLTEASTKLESLQSLLKKAEKCNEDLNQEINEIREELRNNCDVIERLNKEVNDLAASSNCYKDKNQSLEKELKTADSKSENLLKDLEAAEEEVRRYKETEVAILKKLEEKQKSDENAIKLAEQITHLKDEITRLSSETETHASLLQSVTDLNAEIALLRSDLEMKASVLDECQSNLMVSNETVRKLEDSINLLTSEKMKLVREIELKVKEVEALTREKKSITAELESLQNLIENLQGKLNLQLEKQQSTLSIVSARDNAISNLNSQVEELNSDNLEMKNLLQTIQRSLGLPEEAISNLSKNINCNSYLKFFTDRTAKTDDELNGLRKENKALNVQIENLTTEKIQFQIKANELIENSKTYEERIVALQNELAAEPKSSRRGRRSDIGNRRLDKLEELNKALHDLLNRLLSTLRYPNLSKLNLIAVRGVESATRSVLDFAAKLSKAHEELESAKEQLSTLDQENQELAESVEEVLARKNELEVQLLEGRSTKCETCSGLQRSMEKQEEILKSLRNANDFKEKEFENKINELSLKCRELEEKLAQKEEQLLRTVNNRTERRITAGGLARDSDLTDKYHALVKNNETLKQILRQRSVRIKELESVVEDTKKPMNSNQLDSPIRERSYNLRHKGDVAAAYKMALRSRTEGVENL